MTDSDRQDTDSPATVDVSTAARLLGVTPDAVRSRLHRGTLAGEKVAGQWRVQLDPELRPRPGPTGDRQDAAAEQPDTDRARQDAPPVDLAPLVAEIARLSRRNEELSAAAAIWQARAHHLEERVLQLEAGTGASAPEPAGSLRSDETTPDDASHRVDEQVPPATIWTRLARWWKDGHGGSGNG